MISLFKFAEILYAGNPPKKTLKLPSVGMHNLKTLPAAVRHKLHIC